MNANSDRRIFLGWDQPIVASAVDHLIADRDVGPGRPLDLTDVLIVVPTRQAGRRLREALAKWSAAQGTAVIMARTVTPAFFLRNKTVTDVKEVPSTVAAGVWAKLLMEADLTEYPDLFPAELPDRDYGWALRTGSTLARLRYTLADAGLKISDVPGEAEDQLDEPERWMNMGTLEDMYLAELANMGFTDPVVAEINRAKSPVLPEGVKYVVVAAVPAPTPLMLEALKALEKISVQMDVLVHADEKSKDWFDDWGQPDPVKWCKAPIHIPEFQKCVRLAADPQAQASLVSEIIAEHATDIGPNDIAIGVPDATVIPFLESHLAACNLPAFDPSEKAVSNHPLYRLLKSFCSLYHNDYGKNE